MGIFDSIKQTLGVGGVQFFLSQANVDSNTHQVQATITATAKSTQQIDQIEISIVKLISTGRGFDENTNKKEMGKIQLLQQPFIISAGESKQIPFTISFTPTQGLGEEFQSKGGALGALGSVDKLITNEQTKTKLIAQGTVKGTALGPHAEQVLSL